MADQIDIRIMDFRDAAAISSTFEWKPSSLYDKYFDEQSKGERVVLVAFSCHELVGYLTIMWDSEYTIFREKGIPEIVDLNVLPDRRRRGIGTMLMDEAESLVSRRSDEVGIGVGLHPGYSAAHRMYILRGYVPDGKGLIHESRFVQEGETVVLDDDLVLHLIKKLR
jgi:GNAT superfamily N-acetyltransferase